MRFCAVGVAALVAATLVSPGGVAAGDPVPRAGVTEGVVISRAAGETVRFVAEAAERDLALGQDLLGGDVVRTGPAGLAGLRFADQTVMRLHPNSELEIRAVSASAASLTLNAGELWGRARRGAASVEVATPTAAAAIRGTDWALAVAHDGTTRLSVYDGAVRLANDLGTVEARAGQQALAAPGAAPVIVQVANRREAAQMLFAAPFASAADPVAYAADAGGPATGAGAEAYAAGRAALRAGRYEEAIERFGAAAPALDPEHAAAARWLAAFAAAEAGRGFEPPVAPPGAESLAAEAIGRAYFAAGAGDLEGAAVALAKSDAPAARAAAVEIAILRDDAPAARRLVAGLIRDAPGGAYALAAEAALAGDVDGDYVRAARLFAAALALRPDDATLWNELGMARSALDHPIEAEAALRRALEIAPRDPVARGNLMIFLLDEDRIAEARALIEPALAEAPGDYLALRAAARLAIQEGRDADGLNLGLDALAAQPAAAETSILLGIAAYQAGDRTRAEQEFDAAARLDPNDPLVPYIRAAIAVDDARADDAIRYAREAARLYSRGGGGLDRVAADRGAGSALAQAFDNLSLSGWARDVADRTFDPLAADSLASEGIVLRPSLGEGGPQAFPLGSSSLIQALLVDPLAVSARVTRPDFFRRPFIDGEVAAAAGFGDREGGEGMATLQGYAISPFPFGWSATLSRSDFDVDPEATTDDLASATALVGFKPAANFGGFALLSVDRAEADGFRLPAGFDDRDARSTFFGGGVTWRLPERAIFSLYGSAGWVETEDRLRRPFLPPLPRPRLDATIDQDAENQFLAASWRATDETGFWMAGAEGDRARAQTVTELAVDNFLSGGVTRTVDRSDETVLSGRAYLQRRQSLAPNLEAEAGVALGAVDREGESADLRLAARGGLGWRIDDANWARIAGFVNADQIQSLAPFTVLGLAPIGAPLDADGTLDGVVARWDGELGERLHLSVEHQSFAIDRLTYDTGEPLSDFSVRRGRVHVTEARADAWLGGGFGAFATAAWTESEIERGRGRGGDLPGAPRWSGSAGLAFVHPSQVRAEVEAVWLGERSGGPGFADLDPVVTANASLAWEPFDRAVRLAIDVENVFDARVERSFGQTSTGRTVLLSAAIRF